jgi:hypothetical protein
MNSWRAAPTNFASRTSSESSERCLGKGERPMPGETVRGKTVVHP